MLLNEKLPSQVWKFSAKNCPNGSLAKVAKFHTNPYNFLACPPNPYKLSILGDIWRAIILPFSSSKYFYSCLRLSKLVDLSFEYLSFSNKRKTTTLFPSPLTSLQWAIGSDEVITRKGCLKWLWKEFFFHRNIDIWVPRIRKYRKNSLEKCEKEILGSQTSQICPKIIIC